MKLLQIGVSHPSNSEFIIQTCSQFGIDYHCCNSPQIQFFELNLRPAAASGNTVHGSLMK